MATLLSVPEAIDVLAGDPLRHVVFLKQLLAYPEHVRVYHLFDGRGAATMVALEVSASPYDRVTYPNAAVAVFISSDNPELTASLLPYLPAGSGIVFKLGSEADLAPQGFGRSRRAHGARRTRTPGVESALPGRGGQPAVDPFGKVGRPRALLDDRALCARTLIAGGNRISSLRRHTGSLT
jgi:hypothetical protein